ncbi:hypothetical protein AJ79_04605 [Helicocarpus griseus UAMH5409]|uniref:HypA protein n=1 Tax=Helicocarpus griseus UAMH5409 TaxID=1447875 RepID=A0A2B7XT13_9EURO|nr:hypothetical protein AJ79_04605 [Helicocarpus griseus UAMH5409]
MATAYQVNVSTTDTGVLGFSQNADSASKASETLQADLKNHHIFFNDKGFHDHIAHHVLTAYALGAAPDSIQKAYDRNSTYQLPSRAYDEAIVRELGSKDGFNRYAEKRDQYPHYLAFFQRQIDARGIAPVVNEYIFGDDKTAEDMFVRLFGGLIHPFIQLGFGIEFNQPAIVAEALAETAVHQANMGPFLLPAEQAAGGVGKTGKKSLIQLQQEIRNNSKLRESVHYEDDNKILDGVMTRAPDEIIKIASQFSVGPGQVEEKLAELINAVVYFTGAAQHPPKCIKFDFFYLHCVTSAIFLPSFLSLPWLRDESKLRILEWKGRMDLLMYASRGAVEPRPQEITDYKPRLSWDEIFTQSINHERDDGHASKFIRTLAYGEKLCKPFEQDEKYKEAFLMRGDMWIKLANMVIDSIQDSGDMWIMNAGFDQAWEKVGERSRL